MRFYETKKIKHLLFGTLIFFVISILTSFTKNKYEKVDDIINNNFTKQALIEEIKCHGFKYPDIVLAQALLESGHFKSDVFLENNNTFGMRFPKVRRTLAKGSNLNHAIYSNWKESVEDRMIYENLYLKDKSRVKYKQYLDRVYAKGKNYSVTLEMMIKKNGLKNYFNN